MFTEYEDKRVRPQKKKLNEMKLKFFIVDEFKTISNHKYYLYINMLFSEIKRERESKEEREHFVSIQ